MRRNICWSRVDLNPANASAIDTDGGTGVVKTIFSAYVWSTTFPCQLRALPHRENILIVEIILSSSSSYIKIPFIGSFTESCTSLARSRVAQGGTPYVTVRKGVFTSWNTYKNNQTNCWWSRSSAPAEKPTFLPSNQRMIDEPALHAFTKALHNLATPCLSLLRCHPNLATRGSHKTKEFEASSTTTLQSRVQLWVFLVRYWSSDSEIAHVFPVFKWAQESNRLCQTR